MVLVQRLAELLLLPGELGIVLGDRRGRVGRIELPSDPLDQVGGLLGGAVVQVPTEAVQDRSEPSQQLGVLTTEQPADQGRDDADLDSSDIDVAELLTKELGAQLIAEDPEAP